MAIKDWSVYPNFSKEEFDCSHTGENDMQPFFMERLQELRTMCGFPFVINSGFRSQDHPIEAVKNKPGSHAHGIAADIACDDGGKAFKIVHNALRLGFTGIGISQRTSKRLFIHVDMEESWKRPNIWSY